MLVLPGLIVHVLLQCQVFYCSACCIWGLIALSSPLPVCVCWIENVVFGVLSLLLPNTVVSQWSEQREPMCDGFTLGPLALGLSFCSIPACEASHIPFLLGGGLFYYYFCRWYQYVCPAGLFPNISDLCSCLHCLHEVNSEVHSAMSGFSNHCINVFDVSNMSVVGVQVFHRPLTSLCSQVWEAWCS